MKHFYMNREPKKMHSPPQSNDISWEHQENVDTSHQVFYAHGGIQNICLDIKISTKKKKKILRYQAGSRPLILQAFTQSTPVLVALKFSLVIQSGVCFFPPWRDVSYFLMYSALFSKSAWILKLVREMLVSWFPSPAVRINMLPVVE